MANDVVPSIPESAAPGQKAEGSGAILLVDDDENLLVSTGSLIEMMGFNLLTARDGVEALEVFRRHRDQIRCVVTDLTMPRMDGWETLTALRRLDSTLPVIMASGYDRGRVMSDMRSDRPHVFLEKPFGLQDLCDAIGQALVISGRKDG
jgi:DNA-binding NtrC family response regulator